MKNGDRGDRLQQSFCALQDDPKSCAFKPCRPALTKSTVEVERHGREELENWGVGEWGFSLGHAGVGLGSWLVVPTVL